MTLSVSAPQPTPTSVHVRPTWEFSTVAEPRGLAVAREKGWSLIWDADNWLYLLDGKGRLQAQVPASRPLRAVACADDGVSYLALGSQGDVWLLAPDLMPRWRRSLASPTVAAAMEPLGHCLAVSDSGGNLLLLDRRGKPLARATTPRPLHHLLFLPETRLLVGSADFGLVTAHDLRGRQVWRDGLVSHVGTIASSSCGERISLACYSDGICSYSLDGRPLEPLRTAIPCRWVSASYDGKRILIAGLEPRVLLLNAEGQQLADHSFDSAVVGSALSALGTEAVVALADGRTLGLEFH